jgi:hypothetical protein
MTEQKVVDLWPANLTEENFVSPLVVLTEQADLIAEKTNRHLIGEVLPIQSEDRDFRHYGFMIRAPGLEGYRYPLFKASYKLCSLFPLRIESRQITLEGEVPDSSKAYKTWVISNPSEFTTTIAEILGHPNTINAVRALLAESKARGYDPDEELPF